LFGSDLSDFQASFETKTIVVLSNTGRAGKSGDTRMTTTSCNLKDRSIGRVEKLLQNFVVSFARLMIEVPDVAASEHTVHVVHHAWTIASGRDEPCYGM